MFMKKANTELNLADMIVVLENSRAFLGSNHFRQLILFLMWITIGLFHIGDTQAQISPEGRDRTYKQAAPHRFESRFGKQPNPKSTFIPLKPSSKKPVFPGELGKVKFTLNHLIIA